MTLPSSTTPRTPRTTTKTPATGPGEAEWNPPEIATISYTIEPFKSFELEASFIEREYQSLLWRGYIRMSVKEEQAWLNTLRSVNPNSCAQMVFYHPKTFKMISTKHHCPSGPFVDTAMKHRTASEGLHKNNPQSSNCGSRRNTTTDYEPQNHCSSIMDYILPLFQEICCSHYV